MTKMDRRGQISIEFVLILALMAIIVVAIGGYVGDASEQSMISSAVRTAADNAAANLVITNRSMNPVNVENINSIGNGTSITLQINVSGSNQTFDAIKSSILTSVAAQGYNVTNSSVITGRHVYTIQVV